MTGAGDPARDPRARFSDRVVAYAAHRPGYPAKAIAALRERTGLSAEHIVADVGSGTGIFTDLILEESGVVYAVEPNASMRARAEARLGNRPGFRSVAGSAEETTLPPASVHLVTAAQAFHWFDRDRARAEFRRILRPSRWVALLWNDRQATGTPFLEGYEALLLRHGTDYRNVGHRGLDAAALGAFFASYEALAFPHGQSLDYAGLEGRLVSSSYVPGVGEPGHSAMIRDLRALFDAHAQDGMVEIVYETRMFVGRI